MVIKASVYTWWLFSQVRFSLEFFCFYLITFDFPGLGLGMLFIKRAIVFVRLFVVFLKVWYKVSLVYNIIV